jgi:hypothetical protein
MVPEDPCYKFGYAEGEDNRELAYWGFWCRVDLDNAVDEDKA